MQNLQSLIMENAIPIPQTSLTGLCTCDKNSRQQHYHKRSRIIPESLHTSRMKSRRMDPSTSCGGRYVPHSSLLQQSFLHKLWTVGLCLTIIWTFHTAMGQDTMLIQHTGYGKKGHFHCSKHCSSMVANLEQRLHHRIRDIDHRCTKRMESAINANNKTAAIQHTEKLLHHVIEELQVLLTISIKILKIE